MISLKSNHKSYFNNCILRKMFIRVVDSPKVWINHKLSFERKMKLQFDERVRATIIPEHNILQTVWRTLCQAYLLGNLFDGVLFENCKLVIIAILSQIHFDEIIVEMKNIVGGVIGPGTKAQVAHLCSPRPIAVGDPLTQNLQTNILITRFTGNCYLVGDGHYPDNVSI